MNADFFVTANYRGPRHNLQRLWWGERRQRCALCHRVASVSTICRTLLQSYKKNPAFANFAGLFYHYSYFLYFFAASMMAAQS